MEGFLSRFFSLHRPLQTALNDRLAPYDLSYSLWQVLYYVENRGPSMLVDIAAYYNVEKPAITRRVFRLEELGIIEQIDGPDRRGKVIRLTKHGRDIYRTCRRSITELEHRLMDGIPNEEAAITFHTIPKLQVNLARLEESPHD